MQSYVARQPILDVDREVVGYELLFRSGPENLFTGGDDDRATANVMSQTLDVSELKALTNGKKCFVNITPRILFDELYTMLPPEYVVLELLETIEPTRDVLEACQRLRLAGYTLALDDYAMEDRFRPLLALINLLKVDFVALTSEQRRASAARARSFGVQLLAEKVETYEDFEEAVEFGYSLFQGYFFCRPEMMTRRDLSVSKLAQVQLLQHINSREIDIEEVEAVIRRDLGLSYKLLRLLNSAAFSFRTQITSIRRALVLLGERPLRKWASLIAMSSLGDEKPLELLNAYAIRAKFCENLAPVVGLDDRQSDLFMLGLFSLLDAILDRPMSEVLENLALDPEVKAALLGMPGRLKSMLDLAASIERGEWEAVTSHSQTLDLSDDAVNEAYHEAIAWTSSLGANTGLAAATAA